ncbi:plasmid replication protein RepC [Nereida sp. MMG025]|uniref:plasmid replication protein RepC n=1 Tax=Nereida sp. MMG025 TaxID=2909981 RepID=UPI001F3E6723|nr:plasmid replication protein RepC [Nereida sp. MMG025]MCF6445860.1 replication initiation protein RepC [Nereida sp. MMG025]
MDYVPITPFGRTVDTAVLAHQKWTDTPLPPEGVNKWEVLRELTVARRAFEVSDRELAVLQALLSFHPETILGGNSADLLVFPSNAAICERLNGMACSTMRRHLAGLVRAGLLIRRDSPNGKRYVRRFGDDRQAFGFDLTPLVVRFAEICEHAEAQRAQEEQFARLRRSVSLMRRDLAGLAAYGAETRPEAGFWADLLALSAAVARDLRRKLELADLRNMTAQLEHALDTARDVLDGVKSSNTSTKDAKNEHHHQNSNKDPNDLEPCLEQAKGNGSSSEEPDVPIDERLPNIPIGLVLAVCAEIQTYADRPIRHWHDLVRVAETVRPMMGISPDAWQNACEAMGPEEAAVVVVAMLQRFEEIKSPGGYLRHLTQKAEQGAFSCGPMVMALMRRDKAA